jgi:hypothetical protein
MSTIVFGETPPVPKHCLTCKRPEWRWYHEKWVCLSCWQGNPCIVLYGDGPAHTQCTKCNHLIRERYRGQTYLKCEKRSHTRGSGSDHRASWPACARFTPEEQEVPSE